MACTEHNPSPPNMEPRVAKLEATTESILRELLEMRTDIRDIRRDMRSDFHWLLTLMIGGFGMTLTGFIALLGVLARGFHWI